MVYPLHRWPRLSLPTDGIRAVARDCAGLPLGKDRTRVLAAPGFWPGPGPWPTAGWQRPFAATRMFPGSGLRRSTRRSGISHHWGSISTAGIPGIALFLAYAGAVLHEERYTALARRRVEHRFARMSELLRPDLPEIGAFEGWGGLLYTLTHLGVLWDDPDMLSQAEDIVEIIAGICCRGRLI